jgi:hypothetical protein
VDLETAKVELDLANERASGSEQHVSTLRVQLAASEQRCAALESQLHNTQAKWVCTSKVYQIWCWQADVVFANWAPHPICVQDSSSHCSNCTAGMQRDALPLVLIGIASRVESDGVDSQNLPSLLSACSIVLQHQQLTCCWLCFLQGGAGRHPPCCADAAQHTADHRSPASPVSSSSTRNQARAHAQPHGHKPARRCSSGNSSSCRCGERQRCGSGCCCCCGGCGSCAGADEE